MISQQKYIKELLKRFEMESSKTIDTPISTATRLDMDEPGSPVNETIFQSSPKESHLKEAKRLLSYLVDRKMTSGMAHFLVSCLISWGTKKQNYVSLSTAEAECVAVASCCAQLL
ncbi:uncharacterized protein [Nicotiana tomentosiformis]|uniref:uncharacterized protein n=1 Tax=Nicotiana tomentosiformis TaxID=4098 RepID=UPI00388C49EA